MGYIIILVLKGYRYCVSPLLPNACRFQPTCSTYAIECLKIHGVVKGIYLTGKRILRCNPLFESKYDPPPPPRE